MDRHLAGARIQPAKVKQAEDNGTADHPQVRMCWFGFAGHDEMAMAAPGDGTGTVIAASASGVKNQPPEMGGDEDFKYVRSAAMCGQPGLRFPDTGGRDNFPVFRLIRP